MVQILVGRREATAVYKGFRISGFPLLLGTSITRRYLEIDFGIFKGGPIFGKFQHGYSLSEMQDASC